MTDAELRHALFEQACNEIRKPRNARRASDSAFCGPAWGRLTEELRERIQTRHGAGRMGRTLAMQAYEDELKAIVAEARAERTKLDADNDARRKEIGGGG